MRYRGEEAIGLIETIGMVPAIYAADAMLKAGDTELVSYENVGSTLVTIVALDEDRDVAGGGVLVADQLDVTRLAHGVARLKHPDEPKGLDCAKRVHTLACHRTTS